MTIQLGRSPQLLVAGTVIAAGIVGIGVAGTAGPGDSTPNEHEIDTPVAGRDVSIADVLSELGGDHFAGLENQGRRIVSYWVGDVPTEVQQYAESLSVDVTIEFLPARFSRDELTAAAERIANSSLGGRVGVSWVAAKSDGSGLEIGLEGDEPSGAMQVEIAELGGLPESAIRYTPNSAIVSEPARLVDP